MRIYIVRHGQTEWNKIPRWQGNKDVPLDETGVNQSVLLAEKLSSLSVRRIYSSPLKRAAATAEILRIKTDADIIYRQELREIHLGEWEGLTAEEINEKDGVLYDNWKNNPFERIGLGIESFSDLQRRAYREFEAICEAETEDFILVAHGTWTKCLMCKLMDIPLEGRGCFEISNAGITVIECDKTGDVKRYTVITLNDVSHFGF